MRKTLSAVAAQKKDKVAFSWPRLRSRFKQLTFCYSDRLIRLARR